MVLKQCKHCGYVQPVSRAKSVVEMFSNENWIARESDWNFNWNSDGNPYVCPQCGKISEIHSILKYPE